MVNKIDSGFKINQYTVLEKTHAGRWSDIYLADDPDNNRKVALKILHDTTSQKLDKTEWFESCRRLVNLNHDNIAKIYEISEFNGALYIAMEFCEGQSLDKMLKNFDVSIERAIEIISQSLEAFAYGHKANIVHGRINVSHIMINLEGMVKLIGFDAIALNINDPQKNIKKIKHPEYLAPEQIEGHEADARTDIFSAGVVLYTMITGENPFKGSDKEESAELILQHTPTGPSKANSLLNPIIDKIFGRLLAKDSDKRHHDAHVVIDELENFKSDQSVDTPAKKPIDWWNRYIVPIAAVILAIIAILWLLNK